MRTRQCWDRYELQDAIKKCYHAWWQKRGNTTTQTDCVETVANISDWIEPYLNKFDSIMAPLQFNIFRLDNAEGSQVLVQKRMQCGVPDAPWSALGDNKLPDSCTKVS